MLKTKPTKRNFLGGGNKGRYLLNNRSTHRNRHQYSV